MHASLALLLVLASDPASPVPTSTGPSPAAPAAGPAVPGPTGRLSPEEARARYEELRLVLEPARPDTDGRPVVRRARDGAILAPPDLYLAMNRADLASSWSTRRTLRIALRWGTPVVAVAATIGTIYAVQNVSCGTNLAYDQMCNASAQRAAWIAAGAVVVGLSAFGFYESFAMAADPVAPAELGPLVEEYDAQLRRRLRLPASGLAPPRSPPLALGVAPVRGGAVVGLTGTF